MNILDILLIKAGYKTPLSENELKRLDIVNNIKEVKILIDTAENNFNNVTDSDSIDYYSYILKAYKIRHNKLVKELKEYFDDDYNENTQNHNIKSTPSYVPIRRTKQILITEE